MKWIKNIFQRLKLKQHQTNYNSRKPFIEIYDDLGAFNYNERGFTISDEDTFIAYEWDSITQINVFKRDLYTMDRIEMEIAIGDRFFTISEDLPGWYQFIIKTKEVFPLIPVDWDIEIVQPPFARNYRTIYNKV